MRVYGNLDIVVWRVLLGLAVCGVPMGRGGATYREAQTSQHVVFRGVLRLPCHIEQWAMACPIGTCRLMKRVTKQAGRMIR